MNRYLTYKQMALYFCLISPLIFSIIRKILPGQPAAIEIGPLICIFLIFIFSRNILSINRFIRSPLFVIISTYIIFITFSILVDYRIGAASFFMRIVPIFLVFIFYNYTITIHQIHNISKVFAWITIFLFPIAITGILFGNNFLFEIFSPINSVIDGQRELRHGFASVATIFSTPWTMAWSFVGIIGLLGFSLLTFNHSIYEKTLIHMALFSSFVLLFLTMRRGAIVVGILCLAFIYLNNLNFKRILLLSVFALLFTIIFSMFNANVSGSSNLELSMTESVLKFNSFTNEIYFRFYTIFWQTYMFYMENYPLGSFLGAAGPEGTAFGYDLGLKHRFAVEIGAALLVAEMGIFPHLIVIFSMFFLFFVQYYCSRRTSVAKGVLLLLLMQVGMMFMWLLKSTLVLNNPHFGHFFFWASIGIVMAAIRDSRSTNLFLDISKRKND
jgi:hypothetical protein